jgi:RES domain-containing protein
VASEQVALALSDPGTLSIFRYTDYDVPFWARPNSRAGRWNLAGEGPTQYWCMSPDAAWAELIRAKELETEAELEMVRMPMWVCRIPRMWLIDMLHPETQQVHGLSPEQMIDDDWEPCQRAASELRQRYRGIITPNAALSGHMNITLFGARRAIDWRTKPALGSTVPAARTAVGRPPPGLIALVQRRTPPGPQARLFDF